MTRQAALPSAIGKRVESEMSAADRGILETFDNLHPMRDYVIETVCPRSPSPEFEMADVGTSVTA